MTARRAHGKRRFRVTTTNSRYDLPIAPNLLNRNFTVAAPNQAWVGDLTYIATDEVWLFLAGMGRLEQGYPVLRTSNGSSMKLRVGKATPWKSHKN